MIKQSWNIMYLFLIEIIFGMYILILPYSIQNKDAPIIQFFLLMFICSFIFMQFLIRFKDKAKLLFLIFILPALILTGGWIGFHLTGSLLIGLIIFWRTLSHYNEQDKQNGGIWILISVLTGILMIFFVGLSDDQYMFLIGAIMLGQILFIIIGGFIRRWLEVDGGIKNKRNYFLPMMAVIAGMSITGVILAAGMKVYEKLFFSTLTAGVALVSFIVSPFFKWAEVQNWSEKLEQFQKIQGPEGDPVINSEIESMKGPSEFDPAFLAGIIFVIGLSILFLYIFKRNKMRNTEINNAPKGFSAQTHSIMENALFFAKNKTNPPSNSIRKEIFALEKFAKKRKLGRLPYESLSEWMKRIGILDADDVNFIYEKVRYGHFSHSESEERLIKEKLQLKKKELKEIKISQNNKI